MRPSQVRLLLVLVACGLLVVPSAPVVGEEPPAPTGFAQAAPREILTIDSASSGVSYPLEAFDAYKVQFYDVNGDGRLEVVTHNDNNRVYVFDSATGKVLTELTTGTPANWAYRETAGVAIGDVRGNGRTALVTGNTIGILTLWEFNVTVSTPDKFVFDRIWRRQLDPHLIPGWNPSGDGPAMDGAPALADTDGDGRMEIFTQSDNGQGQFVFDSDGTFIWGGTGEGNAYPILTDLNADGRLEVVYATDGGEIMVYDARTGQRHFVFDARGHGANPGSLPKAPAVLDLNRDGRKEIYFGTRTAVDDGTPDFFLRQHTILFGILPRQDLSGADVIFKVQPGWANPMISMRPSAVDVNGDGKLDTVWMDWNTIGHKPGSWQRTGSPNLFALDQEGREIWHVQTATFYSNLDLAVADMTGDGVPEILTVEGNAKWDGIAYRDLAGNRIAWFGAGTGSVTQPPLLVDLDGDGTIEVVTATATKSTHCDRPRNAGCRAGVIHVFATGQPWDNVYEDGLVWFNHKLDRMNDVGERPPVPRGNFSVDVTLLPQGPGFLAVGVQSARSVDRVLALVGGNWTELRRDGSAWVGDLPAGASKVEVAVVSGNAMAVRTLSVAGGGPDGNSGGGNGGNGDNGDGSPAQIRVPGPGGLAVAVGVAAVAVISRRALRR